MDICNLLFSVAMANQMGHMWQPLKEQIARILHTLAPDPRLDFPALALKATPTCQPLRGHTPSTLNLASACLWVLLFLFSFAHMAHKRFPSWSFPASGPNTRSLFLYLQAASQKDLLCPLPAWTEVSWLLYTVGSVKAQKGTPLSCGMPWTREQGQT